MVDLRQHLWMAAFGLGLGFSLSRIGFTDYEQVRSMFLFEDLRLFATFVGAVVVTFTGFALLSGRRRPRPQPIHKGIVPGALLFGVGWALTGACPGVILAQLGEGRVYALLTLVGMLAGNYLYGRMTAPAPGSRQRCVSVADAPRAATGTYRPGRRATAAGRSAP
jgi:uncharacterized protein